MRNRLHATASAAGLLLVCNFALAAQKLQAADVLQLSYQVRIAILWICAAIALTVFAVMIYSIVVFRKSRADTPVKFDRHTASEVLWASVAIMILIAAVLPAVRDAVVDDAQRSGELAHAMADAPHFQP